MSQQTLLKESSTEVVVSREKSIPLAQESSHTVSSPSEQSQITHILLKYA